MDYTIACSALAAPSQCHPAPVLQSVLVASFLANFLAIGLFTRVRGETVRKVSEVAVE